MPDNEILKAELEDGYGRVANLLLEALAMSKLNGKQMSICLFIIRRTYSWGKKSDEITLKDFALACDSSETYMSKQIKQLIKWKVVLRKNYSPGKVPEYEINTRVDEWDKGCLNVQGLNENVVNNTYISSTLKQKDKGCLNEQGLNESIRQGLNNQARVPLNERTRVVQGQSFENTDVKWCLKESSKESIKKDTTTTEEEQSKTGNEVNPVADIGADPIQQDESKRESDLQKIEDYYKREVRKKVLVSNNDMIGITHAYDKYKDVDFIISVMERAKQDNIKRNGSCKINSFNYFEQIFEEEWERKHAKKEAIKDGPTSTSSRKNFKFDKSQFLWNRGES